MRYIDLFAGLSGALLLMSFSSVLVFADDTNNDTALRKRLQTQAAILSDWLQHYSSLLPPIDLAKGNNDNAFAEETSDPYTDQTASDIGLTSEGSDYEVVFSCDFTSMQVTVAAVGKNLPAMKTAEIGLFPNPLTDVTRDSFNPDYYKVRGEWAVATKRIIPNGDHGIVVGQWGGKYVNACRDNGEFRAVDALYCSRSNTNKLHSIYDKATISSASAPSQLFDFRNWSDFEMIKISLLNGTQYIFTQDFFPNQEPFKSFFNSCSPDRTKVFGEGFYDGTIIFRPELAGRFRDRPEEARSFFESELLATREFKKLTE